MISCEIAVIPQTSLFAELVISVLSSVLLTPMCGSGGSHSYVVYGETLPYLCTTRREGQQEGASICTCVLYCVFTSASSAYGNDVL